MAMTVPTATSMVVFICGAPRWTVLECGRRMARGVTFLKRFARRLTRFAVFALRVGTCPIVRNGKRYLLQLGGKPTAGKMLKSTGRWIKDGIGTDAYSFAALPAGNRYYGDKGFYGEGYYACFWSSTEYNSRYAYYVNLLYRTDKVKLNSCNKYDGYSVRCVKD